MPRPTEAQLTAQANDQAASLEAIAVVGFPAADPMFAGLNGPQSLWTRRAADFVNYRPYWSRPVDQGDRAGSEFFLYYHSEGWVMNDQLLPHSTDFWAKFNGISGGVPLGETSWCIKGPPRSLLTLQITGYERVPEHQLRTNATPFPGLGQTSAATRIQAAERGRQTRQELFLRPIGSQEEPEQEAEPQAVCGDSTRICQAQAVFRGYRLRQHRRWAAEEPESLAQLSHILRSHSLGHLLPYFVEQLHVCFDIFCDLTSKRLGGTLYPHVDFDRLHTTSKMKINWGLDKADRVKLQAVLRKLRIQRAAREKTAANAAQANAHKEQMVQLRAQRAVELQEAAARKERLRAVRRSEMLETLCHKQRQAEAAKQRALLREQRRQQLQATVATAERMRQAAEADARALRRKAEAEAEAEEAIVRQAQKTRTEAMDRVPSIGSYVRIYTLPALSAALTLAVDRPKTQQMNFVVSEKLDHAGCVGTVVKLDRADDSVLLRISTEVVEQDTRQKEIWMPVEALELFTMTVMHEQQAELGAASKPEELDSGLVLPALPNLEPVSEASKTAIAKTHGQTPQQKWLQQRKTPQSRSPFALPLSGRRQRQRRRRQPKSQLPRVQLHGQYRTSGAFEALYGASVSPGPVSPRYIADPASVPRYSTSVLEQNRQQRQAQNRDREVQESQRQLEMGWMFYRLREKERGSAPAS